MEPKFIVWGPAGPYNPRETHANRDDAKKAARAMAERHPNQRFFVCVTTDAFIVATVTYDDMSAGVKKHLDEDIPF